MSPRPNSLITSRRLASVHRKFRLLRPGDRMVPADHDVKDMVVSGCRVRLAFFQTNGRWSVQGKVECGLAENSDVQSFETGACPTREDAEQEALGKAADLLGRNVDRNTSRVKNWS